MEPNPSLVVVCARGARHILLGGFWSDVPAAEQEAWQDAAKAILTGDETGLSEPASAVLSADYTAATHSGGGSIIHSAVHAIEAGWFAALASPKSI